MRREDLFIAIGMVEESRLAHRVESVEWKRKRAVTIWLVAVLTALMLFLMGSAVAIFVKMRVEQMKMFAQSGKSAVSENTDFDKVYLGEKVSFDAVGDEYIPLGSYYPQEIPDGYTMTFVSDDAPLQNQTIHYKKGDDMEIRFWIYVGDPASSIEIYEIQKKHYVDINGLTGILYEQKGDTRTLVWSDPAHGYGFALRTDDKSVDLLTMARSTKEGEKLKPTRSEKTKTALKELGDHTPQYLPEGYEELNVQGSPICEGGGWYSYVRKLYINPSENKLVYFEYETYRIVTEAGYTDDARTACSFFIPGYYILKGITVGEEVTINDMFGIAAQNDIAWCDPQRRIVYHLYSKDISSEELLEVAKSITENNAG